MEPQTGAILGMTSLPAYNPEMFFDFNKELFQPYYCFFL